ncbi:hypothetical protein HMI54_009811 [Coelomomyces lativittatus]|nr:hypothetical protein HMI54_009811 [Coelomomyces lativittatus]
MKNSQVDAQNKLDDDPQQKLFTKLAVVFREWQEKSITLPIFLNLPDLQDSIPKDFPRVSTPFLIRRSTFEIFQNALEGYLSTICETAQFRPANWGNLIEDGLNSKDESFKAQMVSTIFDELSLHTKNPILLIFDEINGIWEAKHENSPFFKYATHFNRIVMKRGWKLISGTGHAQFLNSIPNGLEPYVIHIEPWESSEFRSLLVNKESCHPYLYEILTMNEKEHWITSISDLLGRVPRQLKLLNLLLQDKSIPNQPTAHLRIRRIMEIYEAAAFNQFTQVNLSYLAKLDPSKLKIHLNSLSQTFALASDIDIRQDFMDNSLMYYNKNLRKCLPINPVAGRAIVNNLRKNYIFAEDPDISVILKTSATRSEKTKAFERIIFRKILLSPSNCSHSKLDGSDKRETEFVAEYSQIIPNDVLIPTPPNLRALLIPEAENYPIADCILVDPKLKQIKVLLMTISHVNKKIPGPDNNNTFSCIYDQERYHNIVNGNKRYGIIPKMNFATELLSLIEETGGITVNPVTHALEQKNSEGTIVPCQVLVSCRL